MQALQPRGRVWLVSLALALVAIAVLFAMDRPPICTCGYVDLWHPKVDSGNSQHIADWYAPSHYTHGLIMAWVGWLLWRKWKVFGGAPAPYALPIAVVVESLWEIAENTPFIINRYREVTIAWGYSGDAIINSAADIGWMTLGFLTALHVPGRVTLLLALCLELAAAVAIRDNLTMNVIQLLYPLDAIAQWQTRG